MGEVLGWFADAGLEFVRGIPSLTPDDTALPDEGLFTPAKQGSSLDRFVVQTAEIWRGSHEGGFFLMVGRKPERVG